MDIQPQAQILEDSDDALHNAAMGDTTKDQVEYADVNDLKPGGDAAPVDPAAKPEAKAEAAKQPAPAAAEEDDLPPEYKGKSIKEIVKMHQDAHRLIGRQGTELGELRGRADQAFRMSMEALKAAREQRAAPAAPKAPVATPEELDETFFTKPSDAIAKAIASNPVIQEIQRTLGNQAAAQASVRAQSAAERFNSVHPDAGEILRDPEFRKWVGGSRVRQALLQRADKQYDFEAGDEVFSTWKALRGVKAPQARAGEQSAAPAPSAVSAAAATLAKARQAKAEAAAKAAAVPTSGAGGAPKPSSAGGQRIYRRADVVRLMVDDPERYESLSEELQRAYAEGRVR